MVASNFIQHLEDAIYSDLNNHPQEEKSKVLGFTQSNFPRAYILGDCYGVMLHPRGINDLHVCFTILVEDDGYWYIKKNTGGSSHWLSDLRTQLFSAEEWCKQFTLPDIGEYGIQYGYRFKQID